MLGVYNYTVILTYIGMLSGFAGICFAGGGNVKAALICLIVAGVCDMFDGKIASTLERNRQEKRFGVQIDSLSDLICFGVLPAFVVCAGASGVVRAAISGLYVLAALIRLAWFNVSEEERQDSETGGRKAYQGLPVTSAALFLPLVYGLCDLFSVDASWIASIALLLMGAAFLTPFRLKKPALVGKIVMVALGLICLLLVCQMGVAR